MAAIQSKKRTGSWRAQSAKAHWPVIIRSFWIISVALSQKPCASTIPNGSVKNDWLGLLREIRVNSWLNGFGCPNAECSILLSHKGDAFEESVAAAGCWDRIDSCRFAGCAFRPNLRRDSYSRPALCWKQRSANERAAIH